MVTETPSCRLPAKADFFDQFTGPNSPLGHGSLIAYYDAAADYIMRWCSKIARQGIKSMTVKPDALREYNEYSQEFLKKTVWSTGCRSWYKNHTADGPVTAMYAGSVLHYRDLLQEFRTEDYDIRYLNQRNRFEFMGGGITDREAKGGNLGYYLEK